MNWGQTMFTKIKNTLSVNDVMLNLGHFPNINESTMMSEVFKEMDKYRLGIVCITNSQKELCGIITDGDIRRKLISFQKPIPSLFVEDAIEHSIKNPIFVKSGSLLIDAIEIMKNNQVWDLPVLDKKELIGLLHLHSAVASILEI